MLTEYKIYYEGDYIANIMGIDEYNALNKFKRNSGAGYAYGRLRAVEVKEDKK